MKTEKYQSAVDHAHRLCDLYGQYFNERLKKIEIESYYACMIDQILVYINNGENMITCFVYFLYFGFIDSGFAVEYNVTTLFFGFMNERKPVLIYIQLFVIKYICRRKEKGRREFFFK